jgi:pyroglutamyl-peptidase
MRLLLTCFEPFGRHVVNPSMLAVQALRPRAGLLTRILPVVYDASALIVRELIETQRPEAVMCLGLSARSPEILLERIAVNLNDDVSGDRAGNPFIEPSGPAGYVSTLPLTAMCRALQDRSIPVGWSNHAGTYVCNHIFYTARHTIERRGEHTPCGFVHVPPLGEEMPLERLVEAVETMIDVIEGCLVPSPGTPGEG